MKDWLKGLRPGFKLKSLADEVQGKQEEAKKAREHVGSEGVAEDADEEPVPFDEDPCEDSDRG